MSKVHVVIWLHVHVATIITITKGLHQILSVAFQATYNEHRHYLYLVSELKSENNPKSHCYGTCWADGNDSRWQYIVWRSKFVTSTIRVSSFQKQGLSKTTFTAHIQGWCPCSDFPEFPTRIHANTYFQLTTGVIQATMPSDSVYL